MDNAFFEYQQERKTHWDLIARNMQRYYQGGKAYRQLLSSIYARNIPKGQRVLELGCADGSLLAALAPGVGVGIDFSPEMLNLARTQFPQYRFLEGDLHHIHLKETFDYIILSDVVNELWDIQSVLENIRRFCVRDTRLILNFHNRMWEIPLRITQALKWSRPSLPQNWVTGQDVSNLLSLTGYETIRTWRELLFPFAIPWLSPLFNQFLGRLWPFTHMNICNFMSFRMSEKSVPARTRKPDVSVIIPVRNEAGNIPELFTRIPHMGRETELVFVEGHSTDDSLAILQQQIASHPGWKCQLLQQGGDGKADAVRSGFENARGEILMILDADLGVAPEDLPRFYEAITNGKGEFIMGVRLVYPVEKRAMPYLNLIGNKFINLAIHWLLGQPIRDTLCGTKVLRKSHYQAMCEIQGKENLIDPFGDFDLLLGAARMKLQICEIPIRYHPRRYGRSKTNAFAHGFRLLKYLWFAAGRSKFS